MLYNPISDFLCQWLLRLVVGSLDQNEPFLILPNLSPLPSLCHLSPCLASHSEENVVELSPAWVHEIKSNECSVLPSLSLPPKFHAKAFVQVSPSDGILL